MQHGTIIFKCPFRPTCNLFPDDPVFYPQLVIGEWLLVKDMPEFPVDAVPVIVVHCQQPVFHPESVVVVLIERVFGKFDIPVFQVSTVEELDPFFLLLLLDGRFAACQQQQKKIAYVFHFKGLGD